MIWARTQSALADLSAQAFLLKAKSALGDDRPRQGIIFAMCTSRANDLVKSLELLNAKNLVAKAKGIVSPYFGIKDFAPAYALA